MTVRAMKKRLQALEDRLAPPKVINPPGQRTVTLRMADRARALAMKVDGFALIPIAPPAIQKVSSTKSATEFDANAIRGRAKRHQALVGRIKALDGDRKAQRALAKKHGYSVMFPAERAASR